jgi:adenylate cyclase
MSVPNAIRYRKQSALSILATSLILGVLYPVLADSPEDWVARLNGLLIGLLGGVTIIFYEFYLFFLPKRIYSFTFILVSKIVTYTVTFLLIIVTIICFTRSLEGGVTFLAYLQGEQFRHFLFEEDFVVIALYALTIVGVVITTRQVSRKMGPGVLFNYVIGKYRQPKREYRIFLAMDLQQSTTIAEQLGELKYHEFLKRYFYDLTYSIAAHGGNVYRYVGDQVVVSWMLDTGLKNSNAVQCFFSAREFIKQHEKFYQESFNIIPSFRGVLDMGEVLTAEVGFDKQQLVFYGDVVQRIGEIEKVCKREHQDIVVSEFLAVPMRQNRGFDFTVLTQLDQPESAPIQLLIVKPTGYM